MILKTLLVFLCLISSFVFPYTILATVGGPKLLSDFGYDKEEKLVYFVSTDYGGMGGETVRKYDPGTGKIESLFGTFDVGVYAMPEKEWRKVAAEHNCSVDEPEGTINSCILNSKKEEIWSKLKPLPRINLTENNIDIEVLVREFIPEDSYGWAGWAYVTLGATITQNNKKISQIEFETCDQYVKNVGRTKEFEVNFDGLLIPGLSSILLLVSTRGDCFEYGYVVDKVFPLTNVQITNPEPLLSLSEARVCEDGWVMDWVSRVCPTSGGIFVNIPNIPLEANIPIEPTEPEEKIQPKEPTEPVERRLNVLSISLIGITLFLVVAFFFYFLRKKRRRKL